MGLIVAIKTKGEIISIRTIEIKEEEEEGKELEEEAIVETISTAMKKGIGHLNVLSGKKE